MSWLDQLFQSKANPDASSATKGIMQLAGDLAGTGGAAATPRVSGITGAGGVCPVTATRFDYAGNTKLTIHTDEATIGTTDATVTNLYTWSLANNAFTVVDAVIQGFKSDKTQAAVYKRSAYFRQSAGVVTQMGTTVDNGTQEDDSTWDGTIDFTSTTGRIRVTGRAATNITWVCTVQIFEAIP